MDNRASNALSRRRRSTDGPKLGAASAAATTGRRQILFDQSERTYAVRCSGRRVSAGQW